MGLKLLIADDEDTIRRGMTKYMQLHTDRFSKIYEAENGQEALNILLQYQPQVMLLDVQMPVKSGIEVLQEAKRAGIEPITIILSGYDEFKYAQQALHLGAKEYLLKPVRAADILACINQLADEAFGTEGEAIEQEFAGQENRSLQIAQEYIAEHFTEDISLSDVAEKAGISAGYLSTLFSRQLQCKYVDYLNQIRITRACTYLAHTVLKTYEVAYRVGFRDEKYFSRVFKRIKGMNPKEYRQSLKK